MKIITCTGYYGTGSSAITDLMSEFNNVYSMGDYEFRFIQDPEGVSDLEYNLVENHHRHNSGHALKRYKKNVDFLSGNILNKKYSSYFDGKFKEISYEYINQLTDFKSKGMWHQDVIDRGKVFYIVERSINKLYMLLRKVIFNKCEQGITLLKNEITYYSKPGKKFYDITREYTDKLFEVANLDKKEYIMVDQLVPPTNLSRYTQYFSDIKVIVVDRDPRDIYLLEKLYWKGTVVPCNNVKEFCKWFKYTRNLDSMKNENKKVVLRIQFEDLIFNYEQTVERIIKFLGISEHQHIMKKHIFNPNISIKNTMLWNKHAEYKEDMQYIEQNLDMFIYKK